MSQCPFEIILKWESVKDNLMLCLRAKGDYDNAMVRPITRPLLDLEQYVRIEFEEFTCVVTYELCDAWDVSPAEVFKHAKVEDPVTLTFGQIAKLTGQYSPEMDACPAVLLSTRSHRYGASVILNDEYMAEISAIFDHRMILIPSSVHEWFVVPECDTKEDKAFLRGMVKAINNKEVAPEDRLSDNIYLWKDGKLSVA